MDGTKAAAATYGAATAAARPVATILYSESEFQI